MIIASDIEGTLTTGQIGRAMSRYLRAQGRALSQTLYFASVTPGYFAYKAGLLDGEVFKHNYIEGILRFFRGYTAEAFDTVSAWVVDQVLWPARREDVIAELRSHADAGHRIVLTSGGFTPIVAHFADRAGVAEGIGTTAEFVEGRLTGRVTGPHNTGRTKAENLRAHLDGAALDMAYGDSLADQYMLQLSRDPVAVYPEGKLARLAAAQGWRVIGER